ncbi:MAG: FAD-dependent monooxygenase [Sandaracinus sp.]
MSHAVVIGGSISGLLSAAALSRVHARVTVYERDASALEATPRRGVPQGHHAHALLKAGEEAIEALLPGTRAELVSRGAHRLNFARDVAWLHHGRWKLRHEGPLEGLMCSRPLVEKVLSDRVLATGRVTIHRGRSIDALRIESDRVRGVSLGGIEDAADVVVDASGRAGALARTLGVTVPLESTRLDLRYVSRSFRAPASPTGWRSLIVYPDPPGRRFGLVFPVENGRWIVTLGGWHGDHPPTDDEGFRAFAWSLADPAIAEAIAEAEPLGDIQSHAVPGAVWRRWDRVPSLPRGLVMIGDVCCALDPVFGQGMTVAARCALALAEHLARDPRLERPRELQHAQAGVIRPAWLLATSEDLRFPETEGARAPWLPWLQAYTRRVFLRSADDPEVYDAFLRVMHLVAPPTSLFAPRIALRVLGGGTTRPPTPALATPSRRTELGSPS